MSFRPDPNAAAAAFQRLEKCIEEVGAWMTAHSLKLNENKSEFIMFGSRTQLSKISVDSLTVGDAVIHASNSCRNLGVTLDSCMTVSVHVSNVCKSVRYQLRNLGFIRKYLTRSAAEKKLFTHFNFFSF